MILPIEFEKRMRDILGGEYESFAAAMDTLPVRSLRVNTLKCTAENFEKSFGDKITKLSFCGEGYIFENEHIGSHPLHHAGAIYVQEPAAMAAVECPDILPGMKILDVCASPGGKSTQAAAKLCGEGVIVSNEIDRQRCSTLAQNIERTGIKNAVITNTNSYELGKAYRDIFDLVIVDAPCSGEGMMRKNPLAVSEWSIDNIEMCARRQVEILENIAGCVRPGGCLLYSTCTFAPEENEMQICRFLAAHSDFHLTPVKECVKEVTADGLTGYNGVDFGEELKLCRRFYPHISRGEGQFMALLVRDGAAEAVAEAQNEEKQKKGRKNQTSNRSENKVEENIIRDFLLEVLTEEGICESEKYQLLRDNGGDFFLATKLADPMPAGALRCSGVKIGEVRKGRVIPHHSFFMAYGRFFLRQIRLSVTDDRVAKYLHGESITASCENGFAAVLIGDAPVGGAKVTQGEAKNYYPKGLRI